MRAAILTELNKPLQIVDLLTPAILGEGQVSVQMKLAGICGAQLQEIRGDKQNSQYLPHMLGHEGVGVALTGKHMGKKVCCHWRKGAGAEADPIKIREKGNGNRAINCGPICTFTDTAIISENRLTPIPEDVPDEFACLLGCCMSTAIGVIENEAKLRMAESVLIVGCGGIGLACAMVARALGAYVTCTDKVDKRELALKCGAHNFIDSPGGNYEVVIETTGSPEAFTESCWSLVGGGRLILVGQPPMPADLRIESGRVLFDGEGSSIKATQAGGFRPQHDLLRYSRSNKWLPWKELITHRVSLNDVNKGIDLMRSGQAGRVLIDFSL